VAEIVLDDLTKVYDDGTEAVSSLDLKVPGGDLFVLVGPSGCGKTTALRMVAGLEEITSGTIRIGERIVNDVAPKDRDVAMVFQNYALYPHMSVYLNMAFGLKLRKLDKREIDRRVRETARILGLGELLERRPGQLSGGQRQRVAMGRAIVREPLAFLMDEPLSNLDAKLRVQMRTEILRIQRDVGVTTIYVTHDQIEAMTMGDQVAVMNRGVLQQVDAPQTLYARPRNLFVAGFIGSPAMNMVEARLAGDDGEVFVEFGSNRLPIPDATLAGRPALRAYRDRNIVLGLRPEDMEDAALVHDGPEEQRISAVLELREDMGPEVYAHFTIDAPPVLTDDTRDLAVDAGDEALAELEERASERQTPFTARFNAHSGVREGDRLAVFVDAAELHFFDPESGEGIYADGAA
jgi:multiple sugar transport system ATP-binding protein